MTDFNWSHCRTCRFFGSRAAVPLGGEEAPCRHPTLAQFELSVFGASGCNGWALRPGLSERSEHPQPQIQA